MSGEAQTQGLVGPGVDVPSLGNELVDEYLRFTAARVRPNTLIAQVYDLKVFFAVVAKAPGQVGVDDVLGFIESQRAPRLGGNVVRLADGERGLAASTIKRRLATIASLFDYLVLRGLCDRNPVPRSMGARHRGHRGVPLVRAAKKLPRVLSPAEVNALVGSLRTERDRAMIALMVHGGLRRCEVLGLRFADVHIGDQRVFIAEGKGGHQRLVPIADTFFSALGAYLQVERPAESDNDRVFVVLKGPRRGQPLSAAGLDQILAGARQRAGLAHATCHELRHTCFTRLRESGMALEAIQAQAGHASIETTRIYLHLSNDWLAGEYHKAMAILDALHDAPGIPMRCDDESSSE
ncbi:tyrosine-type recombinase/integrase [Pseudactinotalea sp. Z1739]|uniref:tyrosine-type recombinase/integrase n=1 Tax=Pseudactinotalea sp. Z1739 TaxID=3413028 RepID=UPI003C7C0C98